MPDLPAALPEVEGLELAVAMSTASEVGGDSAARWRPGWRSCISSVEDRKSGFPAVFPGPKLRKLTSQALGASECLSFCAAARFFGRV